MKHLKFLDKIVWFANILAAFLLLTSYILPYIPPKKVPFLSVLSLSVPLLIIANILFCMYWLLKTKKHLLLSLIVILIGYKYINTTYKFQPSIAIDDIENITVINYNVRLFNIFNWLPSKTVKDDILSFIKTEQPDILSIQEYHKNTPIDILGYYKFEVMSEGKIKSGQAIFSKFPIINSGSIDFPDTANNAIFVDVIKKNDTIRIYNLHLQSSGINTNVEDLNEGDSKDLFNQVSVTFKKQQSQAERFLKHKAQCHYPIIIAGDFNNTAYSYVYKEIKGDFLDAFEDAGNGFGRTYDFKFFPVRIDFILTDEAFKVNGFKTYKLKLSDHYPIKATLKLH